MAPAAARRHGDDGAAVLRQGFAKHYGGGGCVGEGEGSASTYPCRSLSGSIQVNGVDGVVLVVIQITDDLVPNGQHLRVQHTYSSTMSPTP